VAKAGATVAVHAFLDGRDTPPSSGREYVAAFERSIAELDGVRIATVGGRHYAMDRANRWERAARAHAALVTAEAARAGSADAAIAEAYGRGETDEFVTPTVIDGYGGMADGDGILVANFRADRVRQILAALLDPDFDGFARPRVVRFAT